MLCSNIKLWNTYYNNKNCNDKSNIIIIQILVLMLAIPSAVCLERGIVKVPSLLPASAMQYVRLSKIAAQIWKQSATLVRTCDSFIVRKISNNSETCL